MRRIFRSAAVPPFFGSAIHAPAGPLFLTGRRAINNRFSTSGAGHPQRSIARCGDAANGRTIS